MPPSSAVNGTQSNPSKPHSTGWYTSWHRPVLWSYGLNRPNTRTVLYRCSKDWGSGLRLAPALSAASPFARVGLTRTHKPLRRELVIMRILGRHVSRLSGYAPAVPTPFDETGAVDRAALAQFCDRQIHEGATALIICGTTG